MDTSRRLSGFGLDAAPAKKSLPKPKRRHRNLCEMITTICLVFSFVLFALATFNVSARWNLIAAGLAFWVLSILLGGFSAHIGLH